MINYMLYVFFFEGYVYHPDLHGLPHCFPPRRSSDLSMPTIMLPSPNRTAASPCSMSASGWTTTATCCCARKTTTNKPHAGGYRTLTRSEEHTSEIPSLMRNSYAVSCLTKKQNVHTNIH